MSHLVFVYGTLKSGQSRESVLINQKYIGVARTTESYALFDLIGFPGLVHAKPNIAPARKIYGEIYEINEECLARLDQIEGVEYGLYSRELITLEDINIVSLPSYNETFKFLHRKMAEAYIYLQDTSNYKECGCFWSSR